jgi:hypothetical protein
MVFLVFDQEHFESFIESYTILYRWIEKDLPYNIGYLPVTIVEARQL